MKLTVFVILVLMAPIRGLGFFCGLAYESFTAGLVQSADCLEDLMDWYKKAKSGQ